MKLRTVVTGHDAAGKAVFVRDTHLDGLQVSLLPGLELHTLWGSPHAPSLSDDIEPAAGMNWFPPAGGVRFFHMILPPDGGEVLPVADQAAAIAEMESKVPGLLGTMEPDSPGMHRSDTIDCLFVLSGHPVLELDDGVEARLGPGDTVVQRGTRHRWHNRGSEPVRMVGVLVGARRKA